MTIQVTSLPSLVTFAAVISEKLIEMWNLLETFTVTRWIDNTFIRRNHSCETQLLNTAEELSRRLDMRQTINLLILDFSKAFDTMPHRRLLHKIQHYGVEGLTNKCLFMVMPAKTESRTRRLFIWRILSHIRRPPGYGTGPFDVSDLRKWHSR